MSVSSIVFQRFYAWYFYIIFGLLLILMYPWFWYALSSSSRYPYANRLRKIWANWLLWLTGIRYESMFEQPLNIHQERYVLCSNHTSLLDIPFFALILNDRFRFMAKIEFADIPIFGRFFKTVDIGVNRGSKIGAYKAFLAAAQSIDEGYHIIIYPEGTTSEHPPYINEFKNGPFRLAIDKQVPIVPVTFLDNWHLLMYDKKMLGKPGIARVIVHAPIETSHLQPHQADELKDQVYQIIHQSISKHYASQQILG